MILQHNTILGQLILISMLEFMLLQQPFYLSGPHHGNIWVFYYPVYDLVCMVQRRVECRVNTTNTHNNKNYKLNPATLPSSGFALSLHVQSSGARNSCHERHCSPWVHARLAPLGMVAPWLVPLFRASTQAPSKNSERGGALALGGHCLMMQYNNQPRVGVSDRLQAGLRLERRIAGSGVCGRTLSHRFGRQIGQ